MIRTIIQAPDERLRRATHPRRFEEFNPQDLIDLRETFAATRNCAGLAAPQIDILMPMIIVDFSRRRTETYLMLNPHIVEANTKTQMVYDGCMSVSNGKRFAYTRRPKNLTVSWIDETQKAHRQKFTGLLAACVHHEIDHLLGILFTDRLVEPL